MIVAAYGSLKQGFYNHGWLHGAPKLGDSTIKGEMYLIGNSYPELVEEASSDPEKIREHAVELYDVPEDTYQRIQRMEFGAGYHEAKLPFKTADGEVLASVFLVSRPHGGKYIEAYSKELF